MTVPSTITDPLFATFEGYGKFATGGAAFDVVEVTNLNDSGPGSLREACAASSWVVPAPGLTGTITLQTQIDMPSDITLDLPGIKVKCLNSTTSGFVFDQKHNFILNGFEIDGNTANWDVDTEGQDLVRMIGCDTAMFRKLTLHNSSDGLIDSQKWIIPQVQQTKSTNVTIQEVKAYNCYQGFLLYADKLSFIRNWAVNVRHRFPDIENGWGHVVNCLTEASWLSGDIFHCKTDNDDAWLFSEYSIWNAGSFKKVNERDGHALIGHNSPRKLNGATFVGVDDTIPSSLKTEARALVTISKPSGTTAWNALIASIKANAGAV